MSQVEESVFHETAYDAETFSPLPEGSAKRKRFGDELQPIGVYARINPFYRVSQDAEAVQEHEAEDPEFQSKDWWWNHQKIRFLNDKVGFKILLLALPFAWVMFLWFSVPIGISQLLGAFLFENSFPEILNFLILGVGVVASLGWMFFAMWVTPCTTNWLMGRGMAFLLKPFEEVINRRFDKLLEDGCSEFNRLTGQVRFALGRKRFFEAPFIEFDAYAERVIQHGGIFYRLMFVHRYTQKTFNQTWLSGIEPTKGEVLALWDMLQRYMDVTEPLPDMPRLEPFRHLDPVTRNHDLKTNRNPRYWRDLDLELWKAGEGAQMREKQNHFPWGKRQCKLTPHLGKVSMAEYRELRPQGAWPI